MRVVDYIKLLIYRHKTIKLEKINIKCIGNSWESETGTEKKSD